MRTVLEKLTLEQTIRFHRQMWQEIAQLSDLVLQKGFPVVLLKKQCSVWKKARINPDELTTLCFPCQYVIKMRQLNAHYDLRDGCSWECPAIWEPHGMCLTGLYSDWITAYDNRDYSEVRKIAYLIAEIRFKSRGYYGRAVTRLLTKKELAKR